MMDVRPLTEAKSLHKAKKGVGVDEKAFIEILCTRSNQASGTSAIGMQVSHVWWLIFMQELRDIAAAYRAGTD